MKSFAASLGTIALAGCTMIPAYERPAPPVSSAWPGDAPTAPAGAEAPAATALRWQDYFTDEGLRAVIQQALDHNRDLRIAALNIERAGALYRIQRSELTPGFGVRGTGERARVPEKITESGGAEIHEQVAVNVGFLSWELDLFGRIRSLKAGALEQYLATEEARRAVQISLVATVADAYLRLIADTENLRLAEATLQAQRSSLDLVRASRDAGVASDLDLRLAESQVAAARVNLSGFAGAVALDRNGLELLLASPLPAQALPEHLGGVAEVAAIAAGLPSEVLLERPDVQAAEHLLRAANANIGAARAAFFPRISLTAALGTLSPDLAGLFSSGTRTWAFAPQIDAPLFAGGLQLANLEVAKVAREIAVAQYEKAIQAAFAEVADALALGAALAEQRAAYDELVAALAEALRLSEVRYRAGIEGYLTVLVAERALYDAQRASVQLRLAERANRVALYKALGGGA